MYLVLCILRIKQICLHYVYVICSVERIRNQFTRKMSILLKVSLFKIKRKSNKNSLSIIVIMVSVKYETYDAKCMLQ